MTLAELNNGDRAIITKVRGRGAFRKRIMEMGFVRGKEVEVIKSAPLRDPIEYKIMGYNVSLRRNEARLIDVVPRGKVKNLHFLRKKRLPRGIATTFCIKKKSI